MRLANFHKATHYLIHEIPKTSRHVFDDESTIAKNYAIMQALGNPQDTHPTVHIAATSGKGTICYLIDALLRAHTKRTGMTQSPHVYDIRERIQINGQLISERHFTDALNAVLSQLEANDIVASYFETLVAMGFYAFERSQVDYVILETGFGGRLDATNVIKSPSKICILGQIGFDHTEALGNSLAKIATEKAGIVQKGCSVIALKQDPEVNKVFEDRCLQMDAKLTWVEQAEDYQKTNDAIALAACRMLANRDHWEFDNTLASAVLQQVFIPGRFEKRHYNDHLLILDGAHNPQKLAAFANRIEWENKAPVTLITAIGEHKDLIQCLESVKPVVKRVIATEYFTKQQDIPVRPQSAQDIASACEQLGIEHHVEISPKNALEKATGFPEPITVSGSFYLLGEIDKLVS